MNLAILVGRLGRDPESRCTQGGKDVCNFSVATGRGDKTEWHNIVCWDKQAQNCQQYLHKGSQVSIEGRIQTRSYDKNGTTVYRTEIVAYSVQFLDPPPERDSSDRPRGATKEVRKDDDFEDDIPF